MVESILLGLLNLLIIIQVIYYIVIAIVGIMVTSILISLYQHWKVCGTWNKLKGLWHGWD